MNVPINKNIPLKNNKIFRRTATLVGINEFSGIMALTVLPLIAIQLYASYEFSALTVFAYSFTSIVAQIFSGPTVDKIGSVKILKFASGAQATFWTILGIIALTRTLDEIKFLILTGLLGLSYQL